MQNYPARLTTHIEAIYDAVTDPNGFQMLINTLIRDLDCRSGVFSLECADLSGIRARVSCGHSEEEDKAIRSYYHMRDIWTKTLFSLPAGRFYSSAQLVPQGQLQRTEFFDFCQKYDIFYSAGALIKTEGDLAFKVGIQHREAQGPLDDKLPYLNQLLPHMQRAARLQNLLNGSLEQANYLSAIVDSLAEPVFLVDTQLGVRYMNQAADTLLSLCGQIRVQSRRLVVPPKLQSALDRQIVEAVTLAQGNNLNAASIHLFLRTPEGLPKYRISVEPVSGSDQLFGMQYRQALALVRVVDLGHSSVQPQLLKKAYSLTDKEAELAIALVEGMNLKEIADTSCRSINTLKTHLNNLFAKTGSNSQSQLIAKVLNHRN